jgi:hypothetical protein
MNQIELEALIERAAARGAKKALADVGLQDSAAGNDIRHIRSPLSCVRLAKRTAAQTTVRVITTGILLALTAGVAIKLKLFGQTP